MRLSWLTQVVAAHDSFFAVGLAEARVRHRDAWLIEGYADCICGYVTGRAISLARPIPVLVSLAISVAILLAMSPGGGLTAICAKLTARSRGLGRSVAAFTVLVSVLVSICFTPFRLGASGLVAMAFVGDGVDVGVTFL